MKRLSVIWALLLLLSFSSCDLIGGIFKAGMWSGVIVVVGLIALVMWALSRAGKK